MSDGVECVWPLATQLGEGPMWSATAGTLWFVDIKGSCIHAYTERGGATHSYPTPGFAAFIFEDAAGRMLCGLRSGLHRFTPGTGRFELLLAVEPQLPANRLNDGYVDVAGRLWFGTMDNEERAPTGALYCFADNCLHCMDAGYVITNGPGMSPDGRILYHVDTLQRRVYAFNVDSSGKLAGKRLFTSMDEADGYPDGLAVDSAGNVWIALFGGWGVRCHAPDGRRLHSVALPVAQCTKVAFGGEDLRTLYITTASVGLSAEQRARQPLAGGLFRTRVEVPGLAANRFAG